jgi:nitric oxide reductase subunit B
MEDIMSIKTVKWMAILSFFLAMVVLLGGGYFAMDNIPPCPGKVVGPDGTLFFAKADILKGQDIYQRYGLMNHGSVWGHGFLRGSCKV